MWLWLAMSIAGNTGLVSEQHGLNEGPGLGGPVDQLWLEAAGRVQSDDDIDVQIEARGLIVAEMGDVSAADRWQALTAATPIRITLRSGQLISGSLRRASDDHLVLDGSGWLYLVPSHSIAVVTDLPRVLHDGSGASNRTNGGWRRELRSVLGCRITVWCADREFKGVLTWVGRDHISLANGNESNTCMWTAVNAVRIEAAGGLGETCA